MAKLFFFTAMVFLSDHVAAQGGWYAVQTGTDANLFSVTFTANGTGWACGSSGTMIKSTDGGSSWYSVASGTGEELISVSFATSEMGFVTGANGLILRTTNGGSTWSPSTSGTSQALECVQFVDTDTAYAVGHQGTILKTTDGGLTWLGLNSGNGSALTYVEVMSPSTIMAVGYGGTILRTTDAGQTWATIPSPSGQNLEGLHFSTPSVGFAVGLNGTMIRTTDGGLSWDGVPTGVPHHLLAVHFSGALEGIVVGQSGTILRTTDQGAHWFGQSSFATGFVTHVTHVAEGEAVAVGFSGYSGRTSEGFTAFSRLTSGPIVQDGGASRSVNWADYDNDGYLDLFVSNSSGALGRRDFLYRNNGPDSNYSFRKITDDPVVLDNGRSDGASFGDYDNDGDLDLFVVNWYNENNMLYENNGAPNYSFTKITTGAPVTNGGLSETCSWGDYDNDGDLDLYVTNSGNAGVAQANFLYRNNGDKTFTRIMTGRIVTDVEFSRGASWIDYDRDGDIDLFVTNEENQTNSLYRNMRAETAVDTFAKVTGDPLVTSAQSSMGASWGDIDNDGDLDVFVANAPQNNALYLQNSDHTFTEVSSGAIVSDGGVSFGSAWGDMDNDGDLDLYVVNSYAGSPVVNFLYKNLWAESGLADFDRVSVGLPATETGYAFGVSWGDYDVDGDLDLFLAKTWSENESNALFKNENANGFHWLEVRCVGQQSNRTAIGATVRVKAMIGGQPVWQQRVVEGQSGYCGQSLMLHFGLNTSDVVDSLVVDWPSGERTLHTGLQADRKITVHEDGTIVSAEESITPRSRRINLHRNYPNPFNPSTTIRFELPVRMHTRVEIYDVMGRLVDRLIERSMPSGTHSVTWNSAGKASGVYIVRVEGGGEAASRKVLLVK